MPTKTPSIVSTVLTVVLLLLFGAVSLFFLIILLNGFSDREAGPALITALVCNGIGIILSAVLAWYLSRWFIGRFNMNSIVAVIVSILAGFLFGGGISFVSIFIGAIVADSIWNAR